MPNGWNFPKMFNGNKINIISGVEDVIKDLKLLFDSEPYEFRFDPGYGSNVNLVRFRPKNQLTIDLLVDAILEAQMFLPNIVFDRNSVNVNLKLAGEAEITIRALIDDNSYITEIQLVQGGSQDNG